MQVLGGVSVRTVRFYFDMYDDDSSGNVEASEIIQWAMKAQEARSDDGELQLQIQRLMSAFDNDNSQSIDFEEFKVRLQPTAWS